MRSLKSLKHAWSTVQKRIDDSNEFYPILDYSFHDAQNLEDAFLNKPRVAKRAPNPIKVGDLYHSYGINLNHNKFSGPLQDLPCLIQNIIINPKALSLIDLSYNKFTEIPIVLQEFSQLKHFYFHCNLISDVREIQKLFKLQQLQYFTLDHNPVQDAVPYLRSYVLCVLPNLRSFNGAMISKTDRKTSTVWGELNKNLSPKVI